MFVKTAARFRSHIMVSRDDLEVNGKSIMGVMMLAAEEGSTIRVRATVPTKGRRSRRCGSWSTGSSGRAMKYSGIAASPGIGLGPIFRLEREEFAVRNAPLPAEAVEQEVERFRRALDASRADLARIRDGIASELGEAEAKIYDTHMMILDDPELLRAWSTGCGTSGTTRVGVPRYMSAVAAQLDSVEDEYLRERRADVLDVERRVLRHLVGDGQRAQPGFEGPVVLIATISAERGRGAAADRVLAFVTESAGAPRTPRSWHAAVGSRRWWACAACCSTPRPASSRGGRLCGNRRDHPGRRDARAVRARGVQLEQETSELSRLQEEPAVTLDGHRLELSANIELPTEIDQVLASGADGVGLFRTEFFYLGRLELPDEEEQYQAYRTVAERLQPRPVLFRTMDLGGDKVASYLGMTHETNPFLGWRGSASPSTIPSCSAPRSAPSTGPARTAGRG